MVNITILTGNEELNFSIERYLYFVLGGEVNEIFKARLGQPHMMRPEMLLSHMWIAEAFNLQYLENPEGFRTLKKFAGKLHTLLLFTSKVPESFPREGSFWLTLPSCTKLSDKVQQILKNSPPSIEEFQQLEKLWPLLKESPLNHHHRILK